MSMIFVLAEVDDSVANRLTQEPALVWSIVDTDEFPSDEIKAVAEADLDKSWGILHFLLTGEVWEGEMPYSFLLGGGDPIGDEDVGYGPARLLRPAEVQQVNAALAEINPDDMLRRFANPPEGLDEVYPSGVMVRPDEIQENRDYIVEYFQVLKTVVSNAASRGNALVLWLT